MPRCFHDFDLDNFWEDSEYARKAYVGAPLSDEAAAQVETPLGYRLPAAYVELARHQNGGIPLRTLHRTPNRTSWAHDHVALNGIFAIGGDAQYSLLGEEFNNEFWIEEWGYPEIGIYFADCPSAGHDMLCLDYRECGPEGEPRVVHVDQEWDYLITPLAENFDAFIRGLEGEEAFPDYAE